MHLDQLFAAAQLIVRRNINEHVSAASIEWQPTVAKLILTYFVDRTPSSDDEEWCSIAMAELEAEFPDIQKTETRLLEMKNTIGVTNDEQRIVYKKSA